MFDRCITCERIGQDCVPDLLALPWPDLIAWWKKRQAFLDWSNQRLSDESKVPVGTINRIKAGEDDARYSTMRSIIHALIGGNSVEFQCQKKLDQEFAHLEELEKQCKELTIANDELLVKVQVIEEAHQSDAANLSNALRDLERALAANRDYKTLLDNILASHKDETDIVRAEAQAKIEYLKDLVAKLRTDNENLWVENKRKSIIVDKYFDNQNKGS